MYQQSQLNKSREDKFLLVLNVPPIMKKLDTTNLSSRGRDIINQNSMQFSIKGNLLPKIGVPARVVPYGGQSFKVSSHSRDPYDDIPVTFTIDNRFNNYWFIYKWLDILNDDKLSYYDGKELVNKKISPEDYQADFTLFVKDEYDVNIMKFTYTKAFPTTLSEVNFDYTGQDKIDASFTFAFSQLIPDLL